MTATGTPDLETLIQLKPAHLAEELLWHVADREPLFIWGWPGTGKSTIAESVLSPDNLSAHNIRSRTGEPFSTFRVLLAGEIDQTDLSGFPVPDREAGVMRFLKHEAMTAPGPMILFMDELNNASPAVLRVCLRLILDPDAYLPHGSYVFAAGNRAKDRTGASVLPSASANRFRHVELRPDMHDWRAWALQAGIPAHAIGYAAFQPDVIEGPEGESPDMTERAYATPRAFTRAALGVDRRPEGRRLAYLSGNIGAVHGSQYDAFLRTFHSLPSIDHLLMDPQGAPLPPTAEAYFALIAALTMRASGNNFSACCQYMERMPEEYRMALFSLILQAHPELSASPAAQFFIQRNNHLVT